MIHCFLQLLEEGNSDPTVVEIARKVGCSVRSIYERFETISKLQGAAAEYAMAQTRALDLAANVDADRPTRIREQVSARASTCERMLLLWRILVAGQSSSSQLQGAVKLARYVIAKRLEIIYDLELATLSAVERHNLLVTLEAVMEFESWGLMREHHELTFEEACNVWMAAVDRLLPYVSALPPQNCP